ncbi:MAG: hypothetical protein GY856_30190, partial [bacterium]|nr:hypothetical protein [bacterium]
RVEVDWRDFGGRSGSGGVVPVAGGDSGILWFFETDNWEMLVKVLDGCAINDRFWVFAAATTNVEYTLRVTDMLTGGSKTYFNPLGNAAAAITDTSALATCGATLPSVKSAVSSDEWELLAPAVSLQRAAELTPAPKQGSCTPSATELCLSEERFRVEVDWRDFAGGSGSGRAAPAASDDSGILWFFDADNWEMLVKVLDGCALNR